MDGVHRGVHKALQVAGGGVRSHHHLAEAVDGGLNQHVGNAEQAALQARGQSDAGNVDQLTPVNSHVPDVQMHRAGEAHQADDHQHRANRLGADRGDSNARHVHVEADHHHQVEDHVHHPGNGQVEQRALGIAHGAQDGRAEVVNHVEGHAQEIDPHIGGCQVEHGVLHHPQQWTAEKEAHQAHEQACDHGQGHRRVDALVHLRRVVGAKGLGHRHAAAHAQADEHVDHQIDQAARGAHRRQVLFARKAAHDHHVRRVEQQLEDAGGNQRQGEHEHLGQHRAGGHVHFIAFCACHSSFSFCVEENQSRGLSCGPRQLSGSL